MQAPGSGAGSAAGSLSGSANPNINLQNPADMNLTGSVLPGVSNPQTVQPKLRPSAEVPVVKSGNFQASPAQQLRPSGAADVTGKVGVRNQTLVQPSKTQKLAPAAIQPSVQTGANAASQQALPNPGPADMNRRTPPPSQDGPGAGGGLAAGLKDLEKAKAQEQKTGERGRVEGVLNSLFDQSRSRSSGRNAPEKGASEQKKDLAEPLNLPDPKVLGPEKALEKVRTLAASASAADAPRLYQHAMGVARELPGGKSKETVSRLFSEASAKAPKAVPFLADRALESAASGSRKETSRYTKAMSGWSSLLSRGGEPYIANLGEFGSVVDRLQARGAGAHGQKLKAPKSVVEAIPGKEGARLLVKVKLPVELASDVPAVPVILAESFSLSEAKAVIAWEPLAAEAPLHSAFRLAPQGGPAAFYRAERAQGRSVLASFRLASRKWLAARASGLAERLRLLVVRILRSLGILTGAAEPTFTVDASPRVLESLRALPPRELAAAPERALKDDPYKLGYSLYPLNP